MKMKYTYSLVFGGLLVMGSVMASEMPGMLTTNKIAVAEKSYVLYKSAQPLPSGIIFKTEQTYNMQLKFKVKAEDKVMEGSMVMSQIEKKRRDIMDSGSFREQIIKAVETAEMTMAGQAQPKATKVKPLNGKTVLYKKQEDGKWSVKLQGSDPTEKQKEEIKKLVTKINDPMEKDIVGTKPRKVGDTWEVDASKVKGFLSEDSKDVKGKFKATFVKIEPYHGEKCAVINYHFNIKGTQKDGSVMSMKADVVEYRSLKWAVAVKFSLKGEMSKENPAIGMTGSGPISMEETGDISLAVEK